MEPFGLYLLKSAVWLTGFTLVFLTVLRNERYFQLNRIYLLSGIIASIAFPLYTWHYAVIIPSTTGTISISGITAQVIADPEPSFPFYWWFYAAGLGWLAFRLIWQTAKVIRKLRKTGYEISGPVKLVRTAEYASSFSFFSFVFVNPSTSDVETQEIVNHESEHIVQRHWFDLILVELLCMLQWFNPFVWIYAHLIRQNHEYLADEKALQRTSNPAIYQATLLNQLLGVPVISLSNSFSYSLNKKRFKMMKKSIHSPFRKLRLLLIIPLMALVFYAFAKPEYISVGTDNLNLVTDSQGTKVGTLKGKVVDPDGKPLTGAAVVIKGTTTGTITDNEGNFKLKNIPLNKEVVISYVGYQTVQIRADAENSMEIKMDRTSVGIGKVVVVGYGASNTPPSPPSEMTLVVKPPYHYDPGLNVAQLEKDFIKSNSDNPPLLLLDGEVISKSKMESVNPDDIGCINALKDISATNKYGEKGKYGVIEIVSKARMSSESEKKIANPFGFSVGDKKDPPLFIVDDSPVTESIFKAINPETIYSVNVLKGEEAIKKFGDKAKNGVVEVILKTNTKPLVYTDSLTHQRVSVRTNGFNWGGNSKAAPLIVLDGIIIDKAKMEAINPDNIESIQVLKDKSATALYGEKGKDGVILITSKKKGAVSAVPQIKKMTSAPGEETKTGDVYTVVEEMPEFPGGETEMMKFIRNKLRYPAQAANENAQGVVIVSFVVRFDGKIDGIKVVRGVHPALEAEALRVIGSMPDWKPGKQSGKFVDVAYNIPIQFKLEAPDPNTVLVRPQFPGGENEMINFIAGHISYPVQAKKDNVEGTVLVCFKVLITGKIEDIKVVRGVHPALDAEAIRVIQSMPDWKPGTVNGEAKNMGSTIPIQFKLRSDKKTEEVKVVGYGAMQKKKEQPFVVVEQMPQYPGGAAALMKFIRENVKYPAQATADKAQGTVIMNFVIRSDGKVDQLNVERGIHPALDAEATRVLSLMAAWSPGRQGGKPVDVSYTVPIQFRLQ